MKFKDLKCAEDGCERTGMDGLYRSSPVGKPAVWKCAEHIAPDIVDPGVKRIVQTIAERNK